MSSSLELISVSFRSLDGKRVTLEVPSDIEVSSLKELLSEEFGVSPEQQRLIYRGRAIQNTGVLGDYVKESGHTIHVVYRPPGAVTSSSTREGASNRTTPQELTSQAPLTSDQTIMQATQPITASTTTTTPGVFVGSLRIERGQGNAGEPQVSITTDLPMNGTSGLMQALMSSFSNLARAPGVQVTTSAEVLPPTIPSANPLFQHLMNPTVTPTSTQFGHPLSSHFSQTATSQQASVPPGNIAPSIIQQAGDGEGEHQIEDAIRQLVSSFAGHRPSGVPVVIPPNVPIPISHARQHAEAVARATAQHRTAVSAAEFPQTAMSDLSEPATAELVANEASSEPPTIPTSQEPSGSPTSTILTASQEEVFNTEPDTQNTPSYQILPEQTQPVTRSTTQATTYINGQPVSAVNNGPTAQPQAVHVAVGALPVGEGANWGNILSSVMGQIGPMIQSMEIPAGQQQPSMHDFIHAATHARAMNAQRGVIMRGTSPAPPIAGESHTEAQQEEAEDVNGNLQRFLSMIATTVGSARRSLAASEEAVLHCLDEQRPSLVSTQAAEAPAERGETSAPPLAAPGVTPSLPVSQALPPSSSPTPVVEPPNRRRGSSLWISNEYIALRLPWSTLKQLAEVLGRATGWSMPPITTRISPVNPSPLSTFLLTYQQLQGVSNSLLFQLQAWQNGTGGMSVANVGHAAHALALSAEIDASLTSLLSWLFITMSSQAGSSALTNLMPPASARHNGDGECSPRSRAHRDDDFDEDEFKDAEEDSHPSHRRSENEHSLPSPHHESAKSTSCSRKRSTERDHDTLMSLQTAMDSKKRRTSSSRQSEIAKSIELDNHDDDNDSYTIVDKEDAEVKSRQTDEEMEIIEDRVEKISPKNKDADGSPTADFSSTSLVSHPRSSWSQRTSQVEPVNQCRNPFEQYLGPSGPSSSLASLMGPLFGGQINQRTEHQETRDLGVSRLPPQVRERFERWTSNPVEFSRAVLSQAKNNRPLSDAYLSGDITSSSQRRDLPSVSSIFGLTYRHSASRLNISDELNEVPEHLSRPYVATMLEEIGNLIREHQDFRSMDSSRYPHLHELLRFLQNGQL